MVAGSRGIRWPSSAPQDAARPRSWPHRLCLCAGFRLAPSVDAVGGVVAFVVCAYRACLLRDDAFDVFLTQRGAQQRRPVDRYAQSIVATISPYGLSISSEWTALRSAMVAGTGSGFGSATGFVEADSALRGASPKGMRGELFITCLLGDFLSKIPGQFVFGSTSLTAHGLSQTALTEPLKMTRGGVSAKMKNKNTWSIPDIAALADYFGVPVMSLLDDTLMRQMLGERDLGASLVAATTARFPVRATEGQADGLKPLETKGSEPRYLVEPGAGEYPQRESNSRCQIESLVS